jgi:transcriptional regulator of acetoin/glycerol metabolism
MHALERDSWPGNLRELVAAVERLMIDAGGAPVILLAHCTGNLERLRGTRVARRGTLTRPLVMQAVLDAGGNKTVAAAQLGVSRKTIHEYVKGATHPGGQGAVPPL